MPETRIDPRALVDEGARIAPGVVIEAGAVVTAGVEIGENSHIGPYAVVRGPTRIGRDNRIYQFCSIGDDPQDKKYRPGTESRLVIGDANTIREYCTINRGTEEGGGVTRVGDDNWIMAYAHIAHDCQVGSHTIFANAATLGGHVEVQDHAILGGFVAVHQFCRVGAYSFTAGKSAVRQDLPPFVMAKGFDAEPRGLNLEGLRRHGFGPVTIQQLKRAYRLLYRNGLALEEALVQMEPLAQDCEEVARLMDFVRTSKRGIIR